MLLLPDAEYLKNAEAIAIFIGSVFLFAVAFAAYKAWVFAGWLRNEIRSAIKDYLGTEEFKNKILLYIAADLRGLLSEEINKHNSAVEAHSVYQKMTDAFIRTHIQQEVSNHNENKVAHNIAFEDYVDRRELNGAIERMMSKITQDTEKIRSSIDLLRADIKSKFEKD